MKVLVLGKYYPPYVGGIEVYTAQLVRQLKDRVDLEVLATNTQARTVHEKIDDVWVHRACQLGVVAKAPISPSMPYLLYRLHKKRFNIIHAQFPNPASDLALLLAKTGTAKLVMTYHSDIIEQKLLLKLYQPMVHYILGKAERIIVTSPNYLRSSELLRKYANKCRVIPLGIESNSFAVDRVDQERVRGIRKDYGNKFMLFVGRLVPYKGLRYLLQALQKTSARLVVVGDGPLKGELMLLAKELDIDRRVHFLGRLSDEEIRHFYHASSFFLLPSITRNEAFGIVQLEAMAAGKPVISTSLDTGVPFVNRHGESGIVVPPADVESLAEAIDELWNDADKCQELGRTAQQRVYEQFDVSRMANQTLDLYTKLLS